MVMAGVCLCLCERFSGREHWGGVGEIVLATGMAREVFVLGGYI